MNIGLLILRIAIAGMMLPHGIAKLMHGVGGISGMLDNIGLPGFLSFGVYVGEIIAPFLIIIGYRTKLSSAVLAFNCLVAILMVHSDTFLAFGKNGGFQDELLYLYFLGSIALFFTGGGKYSVSTRNKWD